MGRWVGQKTLEKIGRHMWMAPNTFQLYCQITDWPEKNVKLIKILLIDLLCLGKKYD